MKDLKSINILFHIIGLIFFVPSIWIIFIVIMYYHPNIDLSQINPSTTQENIDLYEAFRRIFNDIMPFAIIGLIIGTIIMLTPTILIKLSNRNLEEKLIWKDLNFKDVLVGMSRVENKINLLEICSNMNIKAKNLKNKILVLIETGKINATIDNYFLIPIGDEVEIVEKLLYELR
ncbi:MAG: hypothetical protein ACFFC3_11435 [Candidatus Odinarchaeota archaeon]